MKSDMAAASLIHLLSIIKSAGIEAWLDGGWGVDALLGKQNRTHHDVDLIIRVSDAQALSAALESEGFRIGKGSFPNSFILADGAGLEIDIHAVVFDRNGNGVYRMENGEDWIYPAAGFTGRGTVAGHDVNCLTPEAQVLCHAEGYKPVEKDFHDMEQLAKRFHLELPPHLRRKSTS